MESDKPLQERLLRLVFVEFDNAALAEFVVVPHENRVSILNGSLISVRLDWTSLQSLETHLNKKTADELLLETEPEPNAVIYDKRAKQNI